MTARLIAYSVALLLSIAVALALVLMHDRGVRLREGERHVSAIADGMQREVLREFEHLERGVQGLASDVHLYSPGAETSPSLLRLRLAGVAQRNPQLRNLRLARELPAAHAGEGVKPAGDRLRVAAPVRMADGTWTLPLAYPLTQAAANGGFAWIASDLDVASLHSVVADLDLGSDGMANVFHRKGRMLARTSDRSRWIGTQMASTPLFQEHLAIAPAGVFPYRSTLDNVDRIIAFRTIPGYPLLVMAGVARSDVLRGWQRFALTASALAVILAILWVSLLTLLLRARTRQQRLLDSLGSNAARLLEAHRIAGLGEFSWELDTGQVTWSEEVWRIHGMEPRTEPFGIETIGAFIHPDDQAAIGEKVAGVLAGADPVGWEYRVVRTDGSVRTIHASSKWGEPAAGSRVLRGTLQDITELSQARERLREAEHEYRFLFEQNPLPMWVFDRDTMQYLAVNDAAIAHYGYSRDEWLGMKLLDIRPPEDSESLIAAVLAPDRDKYAGQVWTHLHKNGERMRVATYGRDMHFEGRPARMVLGEDVTERERNEQRFQLVARATSDAVWDWDLVRHSTWRSENVFALFGYAADEFGPTLDAWGELLHPEDLERVLTSVRHAIDAGAAEWQAQYRLRRKDGTYAHVLDRGFILRDEHGRPLRAVGGMLDVTEQHRAEADLRLLRRAIEAANNGIVIADASVADLPVVYINPAFEQMTGYSATEVLGRNCRFLQAADPDQPELAAIRQGIANQREARALLRNYRKNGELFWNEFYLAPVRDETGLLTHYVGIQSDVTERQRILEQLAYRATYDELTGLPNRQLLSDRLQQAVANARRHHHSVGVLFIDLDNFKLINDSLGHSAGDEALREVGRRLRESVRDTDTLGRFGGDEFVAVLTEQIDEEGVGRVIERLSAALAVPIPLGGAMHYVSASIGFTRYPDGGEDAETLLRHADVAMYQAKQQGRNRAVAYRADFDAGIVERLHLVSALRDALKREEFCLVFQPIFGRDGEPVALESLVRWRHPERGLLAPGHFIGVCEDSGLIVPLGRWVLRDAARHHAHLVAAGFGHLRIAVNVSVAQFTQDLYADVEAVVREFALPPGVLELELTESLIMTNPERAIETIERLAALGVGLSLDDFGTGYSSLAYLRRLPIQRLKIDRSFVKDLGVDESDARICASIIGLAHSLNLTTVAEGVETQQQLDWLRERQCDEMQGFFLGRPEAFPVVLAHLRALGDSAATGDP